MSGLLDTNFLVRYLTRNPEHLALQSRDLIESQIELQVTDTALAETAYVLASHYRMPREVIVDGIMGILRRQNIEPFRLEKDVVLQALLMCRPSGRVSFTDALIWAAARSSDDRLVYTQDQRFPTEGISVRSTPA